MRNKLFVLDLGRMKMARRNFLGDLAEDDFSASELTEFPISAYLIDGPEGRILCDVGCHPDAMKKNGRWSANFQSQFPWKPGPDGDACYLPNRLEQMNLGPNDIKHVVISHMHSDHAGCLEFFQNSQVIVHQAEYNLACQYYKRRDPDSSYAWKDTGQLLKQDLNWRFITDCEKELSITENITILNWGAGHSAGILGLDISLDKTGHVLLVSDAILTHENFGPPPRPAGFHLSANNSSCAVEKIRVRAKQTSAQIWYDTT